MMIKVISNYLSPSAVIYAIKWFIERCAYIRNSTHHCGPHGSIVTDQSALKHWRLGGHYNARGLEVM